MHIDIVELWFGIACGQISSIFDKSYLPATSLFASPDNNLVCPLILWFGIANEQISVFDRDICTKHLYFWFLGETEN